VIDQVRENEMDGAYSTHWRSEKCIKKFLVGKPEDIEHSKDLDVDGNIISEWILGK
jgi:hypothetical protein